MKVYTYSEARQRLARVLDEARREGAVPIRCRSGEVFVLRPVRPARSPLDVRGVNAKLRPGVLLDIMREIRQVRMPLDRFDRRPRRRAAPQTD